MTIDLTSAGTRGLETLDSIYDLQNVLRILNFKQDIAALGKNLQASASSLQDIEKFVRTNPYLEADVLHPPANNGTDANRDILLDVGGPEPYFKTSLSDPLAMTKLKATDSRIFQSSTSLRPLLLLKTLNSKLKNEFI